MAEPAVGMASADDAAADVINLTEDGGVVKKILVAGTSDDLPEAQDEVHVHYVGTLTDGTKFDSSRDRNDPFSFKLGAGRVIKGWDIGVASMKRGEKAILTCRSDYAYGDSGSPPKIPGGATLDFEVELLDWTSHKDISGDGGVLKDIVKEAEHAGYDTPNTDDELTVKYKVFVKGSDDVVAESPVGGVTLTLRNPGDVLRGIVVAAKTMKGVGEVAKLTLSPQYGYGDIGLSPSVLPGATLEVQLELAQWVKIEDVTDDGGVVRRILGPVSGYKTPNLGAKATLTYTATLPDGTVFDEGSDVECVVDDGNALPEGVHLALVKMKEGEHNVIAVQPAYAFGQVEHKGALATVPPNTHVTYDVKLATFENAKESWEMGEEEKVAAAAVHKDKGNAAFKAGHLARAARFYDLVTNALSYDKTFPDEARAQSRDLKKACYLNLAAVRIKQQQWADVVTSCSKVLESDPDNIKGLFRRAQGHMAQQDFLEAELDIKHGLTLEGDNADLLALSKKLKVHQKAAAKKESALYGKMFKPSKPFASKPDTKQGTDANEPMEQPAAA